MRCWSWCCCLFGLLSALTQAETCARVYRVAGESLTNNAESSLGILHEVITLTGCQMQVVDKETSHLRRLRLLEKGDIDLMAEASWRLDRLAYVHYSIPYRDERILLAALKTTDVQTINNVKDIADRKKTVLMMAGAWYGPEVEILRPQWQALGLMIDFKDPEMALRALRLHRAELLIISDLIYFKLWHQPEDLLLLPFDVHREAVYVMLSKKTVTEAEVELFNVALRRWLELHPQTITFKN